MLLSAGFQKNLFGPISTVSRLGENFGESILVLAPSQVEENWDLRRPLVSLFFAVNPPLIPKIPPPFAARESRIPIGRVGTRGGTQGASWGSADWLEEAGRGKLPECSYSCVPLVRIRRPGDLGPPLRAAQRLAQSGGLGGWVVGCGLGERKD